MKKLLLLLVVATALFSCQEKDNPKKGSITFTNALPTESLKSSAESDIDKVTHAVISIVDASEKTVYDAKKVEVYNLEGSILTSPLELLEGAYKLTDFYLVDSENNILFIAPKADSDKAQYVNSPLAIDFSIQGDEETKTHVEVLSTKEENPEAFGYSEFDITFVKTFGALVSLFEFSENEGMYVLTNGSITVSGEGFSTTELLEAKNNVVTILDNKASYSIEVQKNEKVVYSQVFTLDSLKKHSVETLNPIKILISEDQMIILQPDATGGKDARITIFQNNIGEETINTNFGGATEFGALAWTDNGTPNKLRGLIDFTLPVELEGKQVTSAKLYLYAAENTSHNIGQKAHSQISGSNACFLSHITSAWEEGVVTWNTQPSIEDGTKIAIAASEDDMQNYIIDVTAFINKELKSPEAYHGFMMHLETEEYYRRMLFASSDHEDSNLHPKLVLKY